MELEVQTHCAIDLKIQPDGRGRARSYKSTNKMILKKEKEPEDFDDSDTDTDTGSGNRFDVYVSSEPAQVDSKTEKTVCQVCE